MSRLHVYSHTLLPRDLLHQLNRTNIMAFPKLQKIVVTTSLQIDSSETEGGVPGKKSAASKNVSGYFALELICGQKFKKTRASQFISGFQLRKGEIVGCQSTLRQHLLFSFLDKILLGILPQMREFSGFPALQHEKDSLCSQVSCGVENFLLFPECENHYELFQALRGFQITLVTNIKSSQETGLLLSGYQIPFRMIESSR